MKLSNDVLEKLKFSRKAKARLMYEFNVGHSSMYRWMRDNESDGELTRVKAVRIIAEELGLPENTILTE